MYIQRYVPHLPAAGEVIIFDRSWYNRAGNEKVMGFCTLDDRQVSRGRPGLAEGDDRLWHDLDQVVASLLRPTKSARSSQVLVFRRRDRRLG
jgi:hypothetical protein